MTEYPEFYEPSRIGTLFYPDAQAIAAEAATTGLTPAAEDAPRVLLLIIDMQIDFCHEDGALYVPGAKEDIRRLIEYLYRYAGFISHITCSLDSHYPHQIFHAAWWVDEDGNHPEPMTTITNEDVEKGVWKPLFEPDWSRTYVKKLEERARKQLLIWPYHVPLGGLGHALDPELWSAIFWHSIARRSKPTWWTKGSIPETEHYSVLQPEISIPGKSGGGMSQTFLDALGAYDYVMIAGEAESHCVLESIEDLVNELGDQPERLERIYVLKDCMSAVPHPEIDFHKLALDRFDAFEKAGIRFVSTEDRPPFLSR